MPTVINLKDVTSSDNITSLVEKLNYNFNQLLALGVGQQGPSGPTGDTGGPGPLGLTGETGPRGSKWYTFSDLNLASNIGPDHVDFVPPLDLLYGDLYTTGLFDVYEYRNVSGTGQWVQIINHDNLFNSTNLPDSLVRDFSISGTGNPNAKRFITFIKYNGSDRTTSSSNSYHNDMLFLHNFDQSQVSAEFNTSNILQFYTALNNIYVDHSVSSDDLQVRNHIELGALHNESGLKITKNHENLKIKYKIASEGTRLATFNISKNDGDSAATLGNFNSAFKFSLSKYVNTTHSTLDYAFASSETIRQFTDLSFEKLDGLSLKTDSTKVAFGVKDLGTDGKVMAFIGSTGTGAPIGLYSNLPLYQLGTAANTVQTVADNFEFVGLENKIISTGGGELQLDANGTAKITIKPNSLELISDVGSANETSVKVKAAGRVGIGKSTITADGDKLPGSTTDAPTANLMVNGSLGAGVRAITASSVASEMSLRDTDMSVYVQSLPSGATEFDLGQASTSTLRLVVIANTTSSAFNIKANNSTIGSLIGRQTVIYQSIGSSWIPLMTGPNTFAIGGGDGSGSVTTNIWVSMQIVNIRQNGVYNSFQRIGDLQFNFYANQSGDILTSVNNLQIRVTAHTNMTTDSIPTNDISENMFVTATGGSPQTLFPNIVLYTREVDRSGMNKEDIVVYESTTEYTLESKKTALNTQQGTTTLLGYLKVGETP